MHKDKPKPPPNLLRERREQREAQEGWEKFVNETVATHALLRERAIDKASNVPFDYEAHSNRIELGTHIAYAKKFLRALHCGPTDPMWFVRGVVVSLTKLSEEVTLASVAWYTKEEVPLRVNVQNLAKVGPNLAFCGD